MRRTQWEGRMFRRLSAAMLVVPLLVVSAPAVVAAPSDGPAYLGQAPLISLYAGVRQGHSYVPSPFANDHSDTAYAVAKANIQVTYNGFSAEAQTAFQAAVDIWE